MKVIQQKLCTRALLRPALLRLALLQSIHVMHVIFGLVISLVKRLLLLFTQCVLLLQLQQLPCLPSCLGLLLLLAMQERR